MSTRDREAGYGWGLNLPSIEKRSLEGFAEAGVDSRRPRYAYQGQPLVEICAVGGGCPREASTTGHPDWAAGWRYYRLQVEGLFARFYMSPDGRTWRVQYKGGEILEFGRPIGETYGMPEAVEQKGSAITRWRPVIRRDLQHPNNVVLFRWQRYGSMRGIFYLTDIYDTPSIGSPTLVSEFAHHTQLNWEGTALAGSDHRSPERAAPDFRTHTGRCGKQNMVRCRPARGVSHIFASLLCLSLRVGLRPGDARAAFPPFFSSSNTSQWSLRKHRKFQWHNRTRTV